MVVFIQSGVYIYLQGILVGIDLQDSLTLTVLVTTIDALGHLEKG